MSPNERDYLPRKKSYYASQKLTGKLTLCFLIFRKCLFPVSELKLNTRGVHVYSDEGRRCALQSISQQLKANITTLKQRQAFILLLTATHENLNCNVIEQLEENK